MFFGQYVDYFFKSLDTNLLIFANVDDTTE